MKNEIHELNMTLNQIYRKQDDLYHEYASHFGLSSISFWILYTLCETEDEVFTQNKLADMWHIPRQSLNSAVRTLMNQGYIKLEQMAVARNSKALSLTEEGGGALQEGHISFLRAGRANIKKNVKTRAGSVCRVFFTAA